MTTGTLRSIAKLLLIVAIIALYYCHHPVLGKKKEPVDYLKKYAKHLTREFDLPERRWFALETLRKREEQQKNADDENTKRFRFLPDNANCQEVTSEYELRLFASTNRQAWIVVYDSSKISREKEGGEKLKQFQDFKRDWSNFANTITHSNAAAVAGAIDISSAKVKKLIRKYKQFFNGEFTSHDSINNKDDNSGGIGSFFGFSSGDSSSTPTSTSLIDDLVKVRWYTRGGKWKKESVETDEETGDQTHYEEQFRHGASDSEAELRPSILYKGVKNYSSLKRAAMEVFDSHVEDRTFQTSVKDLEEVIEKRSVYKRSIIMISPGKKTDDEYSPFDRNEFAFHFISRQQRGRDVSDEYNYTFTLSVYHRKMVFAIVDADSVVGQHLLRQVSKKPEDVVDQPLLVFYERKETPSQDIQQDESDYAPTFSVRPYSASPPGDLRNVARNLVADVAQKPSKRVIPAVECETLEECFLNHADVPFIVRQPKEILLHPENKPEYVIKKLLAEYNNSFEDFVEGVDATSGGDVIYEHVSSAVAKFMNNTFHWNAIDGPGIRDFWKPPEIMLKAAEDEGRYLNVLILSPGGSYTHPHNDPENQGSTFQFIFGGSKRFEIINPHKYREMMECDYDHGVEPEESGAVCQKTVQMLKKEKNIDVEIFMAEAKEGDFFCWPPGWLHQIWSPEACLASNGFMKLDLLEKKKRTKKITPRG